MRDSSCPLCVYKAVGEQPAWIQSKNLHLLLHRLQHRRTPSLASPWCPGCFQAVLLGDQVVFTWGSKSSYSHKQNIIRKKSVIKTILLCKPNINDFGVRHARNPTSLAHVIKNGCHASCCRCLFLFIVWTWGPSNIFYSQRMRSWKGLPPRFCNKVCCCPPFAQTPPHPFSVLLRRSSSGGWPWRQYPHPAPLPSGLWLGLATGRTSRRRGRSRCLQPTPSRSPHCPWLLLWRQLLAE